MAGKQKCRCAGGRDSSGSVVGARLDWGEGSRGVSKGERVISEAYARTERAEVRKTKGTQSESGWKGCPGGGRET